MRFRDPEFGVRRPKEQVDLGTGIERQAEQCLHCVLVRSVATSDPWGLIHFKETFSTVFRRVAHDSSAFLRHLNGVTL